MKSEKQDLYKFIRESSRMMIPFYQRKYTWSRNEIDLLLKDIEENNDNEYFFGIILFKNSNFHRTIIDGQQRITTFYLILKALSENKNLDEVNRNEIEDILDDFTIEMFNKKNENFLLDIIKRNSNDLIENDENNYFKNYKIIKTYFDHIVSEKKLKKFISNLKKIVFSVVSLDQNIDEHLVFSRLNSTGKKLNSFDLFKNHLLAELFGNNSIYSVNEKQINDKVQILDNIIIKFNSENSINDLLRRFLSFQTGKLANNSTNAIYKEYLNYFENERSKHGDNTPNSIYEKFVKFSCAFNYALDSKNIFKQELILLLDSFKTYANVIVDIILENSKINSNNYQISFIEQNINIIKECFKILEIYKIRREFCGYKEKYITRFIPTIPNKIRKIKEINEGKNISYSDILFYLLIFKNSTTNTNSYSYPNDDVFSEEFVKNKIYRNSPKFVKTFFMRMSLIENKSIIDFQNYSVEHIMPQNLKKWYENGFKDDENKIIELIDTIGNLTITAYNSEYSNDAFEAKKERMKKNESFYLNNWIFEQKEWNTSKISERATILLERIYANYNFKNHEKKMQLIYDDQIDLENDEIPSDRLITLHSNKSYFFDLDKINAEEIDKIIYEFCCNNLSYEKIENKLLGCNFKGWVSKSIIDALDLKKFKNYPSENFENIKESLKNQRKYLVELISDIQNNREI